MAFINKYILDSTGRYINDPFDGGREEDVQTNTDGGDKELGHGKRLKQVNRLYSAKTFWMHRDDNSDEEM